jgi:long-subunit acyl-CoA synthetase (AMP-forming)
LFAVPTLYKKIYEQYNLMENATPSEKTYERALELDRNVDAKNEDGPPLVSSRTCNSKALDSIVIEQDSCAFRWKPSSRLCCGGRLSCGSFEFMDSIGVPVCEGYSFNRTSPIIAINAPVTQISSIGRYWWSNRLYYGRKWSGEVPDGAEGEICCVGPNV